MMNMKYKTRMKVVAILLTCCFFGILCGTLSKMGILSMSQSDYENSRYAYEKVKVNKEAYEKVLGDIYDRDGSPILINDTPVVESPMEYHKSYSHILGNVHLNDNNFINSNYTLLTNTKAEDANPDKGYSVTLTLNDELQRFAYSLTEGKRGSIVVLKRHSGEILACTSTYKQDFNLSGELKDKTIEKYDKATEPVWIPEYLNAYPFGSAQKPFTAAIAYEMDLGDYVLEDTGYIEFHNGSRIYNYANEELGTLNMENAFIYSANTYFASLFNQIKLSDIRNYAAKALLTSSITSELGTINNRFNLSADPFERGLLAIGQGSELSTLGSVLMLQAVIDNEVYRPRIFQNTCVNTNDGSLMTVATKADELIACDIFSDETCEKVRNLMETTAHSADYSLSDNILGAKSGTADVSVDQKNTNRSTLIAYNEDYIVTVSIIEDDRFGIHNKDILESLFGKLAVLYPPASL